MAHKQGELPRDSQRLPASSHLSSGFQTLFPCGASAPEQAPFLLRTSPDTSY